MFWKSKKNKAKQFEKEIQRIENLPRFTTNYTNVLGRRFKFHDGHSFIAAYREIFENDIYRFNSTKAKLILDCGANMGLSVLYFAINYPDHKIIAFEPDEKLFGIVTENVKTFELKNVELIKKAVWYKPDQLKFYTDGGMGGRVNEEYKNQKPVIVEAIDIRTFLDQPIAFLKLDIEGAEKEVLPVIIDKLDNINYLFFEFHNTPSEPQQLHIFLEKMDRANFQYYIKESGVRRRPFIDQEMICEIYDMAINVFCTPKTVNL